LGIEKKKKRFPRRMKKYIKESHEEEQKEVTRLASEASRGLVCDTSRTCVGE
jgi:hypothetical protein